MRTGLSVCLSACWALSCPLFTFLEFTSKLTEIKAECACVWVWENSWKVCVLDINLRQHSCHIMPCGQSKMLAAVNAVILLVWNQKNKVVGCNQRRIVWLQSACCNAVTCTSLPGAPWEPRDTASYSKNNGRIMRLCLADILNEVAWTQARLPHYIKRFIDVTLTPLTFWLFCLYLEGTWMGGMESRMYKLRRSSIRAKCKLT